MRILIIGAVAAGTSAAAKARRNNEEAEIVIFERDSFISYSGCGMPYFIAGEVANAEDLTPRTPDYFKKNYNIEIKTLHEVLSINPQENCLEVKNLATGDIFTDRYDKLIIATGASAVAPPIKGIEGGNVFKLRSIGDMMKLQDFIDFKNPKTAAIIGTGFIGLEMCESLMGRGIQVTLIERLPQVTPGLDEDMAMHVEKHIKQNGVEVFTGASAVEITENSVILADGKVIKADMVLLSTGVRPNTKLAEDAGVELGIGGAIKVNKKMQTNVENIYACGDCTLQYHAVTGRPLYRPLGSTANKTGRIAGDSVTGGDLEFRGVLGTGIFRIFGMTVAMTGISQKEAEELGYDVEVSHNIKPDRPEYMGGRDMIIKGIADRSDSRLLGVQIVGEQGVDKRLDVFATAITFKAKVEDLFHLDLGYAPPFSTAKDPVMYTGMILDNAINKGRALITPQAFDALVESGEKYFLLDARESASHRRKHIEKASSIPLENLRNELKDLDKELLTVTYCNRGVTSNAAQNILINNGFKRVLNLSGGQTMYNRTRK